MYESYHDWRHELQEEQGFRKKTPLTTAKFIWEEPLNNPENGIVVFGKNKN